VTLDPAIPHRITHSASTSSSSSGTGRYYSDRGPDRITWRYGERGYRDFHLDAGHVCQNLYLASEAGGCGTCAIGAFDDAMMNGILGINGSDQFVIYLATVGKKEEAILVS
jgi:nitroreductase